MFLTFLLSEAVWVMSEQSNLRVGQEKQLFFVTSFARVLSMGGAESVTASVEWLATL